MAGVNNKLVVVHTDKTCTGKQGHALVGVSEESAGTQAPCMRLVTIPAGNFVHIPAGVPNQPTNASQTEPLIAIIARTDPNEQESVVVLPDPLPDQMPVPIADPRPDPRKGLRSQRKDDHAALAYRGQEQFPRPRRHGLAPIVAMRNQRSLCSASAPTAARIGGVGPHIQ